MHQLCVVKSAVSCSSPSESPQGVPTAVEIPGKTHTMITKPFSDAATWIRHFRDFDIPVMDETVEIIASLHPDDDRINANLLAEIALKDPLMTLRILVHVSRKYASRLQTDVETVRAALILLGIQPFMRDFSNLPSIGERIGNHPVAAAGLRAAIERAWRASRFALGFAVHRMDDDADVIHQAALLHDFIGLLLWCDAPDLATEIQHRQQNNPELRTTQARLDVLRAEPEAIELSLMTAWRLPALLRQMADPRFQHQSNVQNVKLAVRIARHTQHSWDNPALPDDFTDLGHLLGISRTAARDLARELDS